MSFFCVEVVALGYRILIYLVLSVILRIRKLAIAKSLPFQAESWQLLFLDLLRSFRCIQSKPISNNIDIFSYFLNFYILEEILHFTFTLNIY